MPILGKNMKFWVILGLEAQKSVIFRACDGSKTDLPAENLISNSPKIARRGVADRGQNEKKYEKMLENRPFLAKNSK